MPAEKQKKDDKTFCGRGRRATKYIIVAKVKGKHQNNLLALFTIIYDQISLVTVN